MLWRGKAVKQKSAGVRVVGVSCEMCTPDTAACAREGNIPYPNGAARTGRMGIPKGVKAPPPSARRKLDCGDIAPSLLTVLSWERQSPDWLPPIRNANLLIGFQQSDPTSPPFSSWQPIEPIRRSAFPAALVFLLLPCGAPTGNPKRDFARPSCCRRVLRGEAFAVARLVARAFQPAHLFSTWSFRLVVRRRLSSLALLVPSHGSAQAGKPAPPISQGPCVVATREGFSRGTSRAPRSRREPVWRSQPR
jgi:hypothetical protein